MYGAFTREKLCDFYLVYLLAYRDKGSEHHLKDQSALEQAITFLRQDPLSNIVSLKMLSAHAQAIDIHYAQQGEERGLLLLFPTTTFPYDRQSYPHDDWIALLTITAAPVLDQLLAYLPKGQRIIFKLNAGTTHTAIAHHFPLTRVTAFHSFTARPDQHFAPHSMVAESDRPAAQLQPLLAAHGHDQQELNELFRNAASRAYTLYRNHQPLAACFTFQNFETVHEIGGVLTVPTERRKGYAKQVVETAISALQHRGLRPRYQVHEENIPSICLAEELGLTRFAVIEHWRYQP